MAAKKRPAKARARSKPASRTRTPTRTRQPARSSRVTRAPARRSTGRATAQLEAVPVEKLGKLLVNPDSMLRQAAARVVGALKLGGTVVERGLSGMISSSDGEESAVAAYATGQAGLVMLASSLVTKVGANEPAGSAARDALRQMGEDAVVAIQAALPTSEGSTRTQLMGLLSSMGGTRSFGLVLQELLDQGADEARATTQALRRSFKDMTASQRMKLLEQLRGFMTERRVTHNPVARLTTVRLMGFIGLPDALEDLSPLVGPSEDRSVRMEALAAIRNAVTQGTVAPKAFSAVARAVVDGSPELAAAALATAQHLSPDPSNVDLLKEVMGKGGKDASRWAAEALGRVGGPVAKQVLLSAMQDAIAAGNQEALGSVGRALRDVEGGPDAMVQMYMTAPMNRRVEIERALTEPLPVSTGAKALVDLSGAALISLMEGKEGTESLCSLWRRLSPAHHAGMLRATMGRESDPRKRAVLAAELGRNPGATSDDKLAVAFQSVRQARDLHTSTKDPSVVALAKLSAQGVDVAAAMQRDPQMEPADYLYVGFRFCEFPESKVQAQGIDLLMAAKDKAGMHTEVGRAAANKLRLMGEL